MNQNLVHQFVGELLYMHCHTLTFVVGVELVSEEFVLSHDKIFIISQWHPSSLSI